MKSLTIIEENNNVNMAVQGTSVAVMSNYFYHAYVDMLPWLLPAVPLILLDLKLGRAKAAKKGESVTFNKSVKMTIDKSFSYICWCMLSVTLSIAFDAPFIKYAIMAIVYGLEVTSCISNWILIKYNIEMSIVDFLPILFRFVWGRLTGLTDDFDKVFKEHHEQREEKADN